MTGTYTALAQLVILALVVAFVVSPSHSARSRLVVAAVYALSFLAPFIIPMPALAPLLAQVLLGIALLIWRRWELGPEAHF
jgi:hypothetical protein